MEGEKEQEPDYSWLWNRVLDGLTRLLAIRLPDSPPAEIIEMTAGVWQEALVNMGTAWDEELDGKRVELAFARLARVCDRWPVPKVLIEHLPPRENQRLLAPAPLSHEEAQEAIAFFRKHRMNLEIKPVVQPDVKINQREWEKQKLEETQAKQAALSRYADIQGIDWRGQNNG